MKNKVALVLVTHSWNGKTTLKLKGMFASRSIAIKAEKKLRSFNFGGYNERPDYRILGPIQLAKLVAELNQEKAKRRKEAAAKATKTRKENGTVFKHADAKMGITSKLIPSLFLKRTNDVYSRLIVRYTPAQWVTMTISTANIRITLRASNCRNRSWSPVY